MMRVFMAILCSLLAVCSVSARDSRQKGTDGQVAIYRLPLFERAVRCTKYFEGWHSEKHHPYVGLALMHISEPTRQAEMSYAVL